MPLGRVAGGCQSRTRRSTPGGRRRRRATLRRPSSASPARRPRGEQGSIAGWNSRRRRPLGRRRRCPGCAGRGGGGRRGLIFFREGEREKRLRLRWRKKNPSPAATTVLLLPPIRSLFCSSVCREARERLSRTVLPRDGCCHGREKGAEGHFLSAKFFRLLKKTALKKK